jgi:uncharacterized protein
MTPDQQLFVALTVLWCSFLQSSVGFGFDLLALPLLLVIGVDLPSALMLLLITSSAQIALAVHQLRRALQWRELGPVIGTSLGSMPLGLYLLYLLSEMGTGAIQQVVGALVLAALSLRVLARVRPRDRLAAAWGYLAGCFGGVLGGLAGISGPPIILWIHAHNWSNAKARVSYLAYLIPMMPFRFLLLTLTFPSQVTLAIPFSLGLVPVSLAGSWIGVRLGNRIPAHILRQMAYGLLTLLGFYGLLRPLFG